MSRDELADLGHQGSVPIKVRQALERVLAHPWKDVARHPIDPNIVSEVPLENGEQVGKVLLGQLRGPSKTAIVPRLFRHPTVDGDALVLETQVDAAVA